MSQQQNNFRLPEQNIAIMVGRLTRDPELRRTAMGKAVCSFDIAISRRIKDSFSGEWKDADPTFVPIIVWGDQAERCGERLKKGFPVHIEGRLQTNKWEGVDGIKRNRLEIVALRVQFLLMVKRENVAVVGTSAVDDINEFQSHSGMGSTTTSTDNEEVPF
jgi:single-strand DNA-binding protein